MSSSGLVRRAWDVLWHSPPIFNLVFWSLIVSLAVDLVFQSRLSQYLPPVLLHPRLGAMPTHFRFRVPPAGVVRLALFGATLLFIVTPFRLAGLYGGVSQVLHRRTPTIGYWLLFFEAGWRLFWRGLAATLAAMGMGAVLLLLALVLSFLGSLAGPVGLILLIPWFLAIFWSVALALMGLGALMANDRPALEAIGFSLVWSFTHWRDGLKLGLLLAALLLAALLVLALLSGVAFLGPILGLLGLWLVNALMAVLPTLLYDEATALPI
jgi:hypothetical protein